MNDRNFFTRPESISIYLKKIDPGRQGGQVDLNSSACFGKIILQHQCTRSEERRVGKSVDLGGRRIIKKKNKTQKNNRKHKIK